VRGIKAFVVENRFKVSSGFYLELENEIGHVGQTVARFKFNTEKLTSGNLK